MTHRRSLPSGSSPSPSLEDDPSPQPGRERGREQDESVVEDLLSIQQHERELLARELHDAAGQLLISLQLNVARLKLLDSGSGHEELVDEIKDTVALIEQEVRSLSFLRFPAELHGRDLPAALKALTTGFSLRTGILGSFKVTGDPGKPAEWVAASLLRIAQEALVNVYRHSLASSFKLHLQYRSDRTILSITDNGIGIPLEGVTFGVGLHGMSHRIAELGGALEVMSLKKGTRIRATVPNAA